MKLDKKFVGQITKVKDGSIVGEDEYVVFLAKDTAFASILPTYRFTCIQFGCDEEQITAVDLLIKNVKEWRTLHADKVKIPDAKGERMLK